MRLGHLHDIEKKCYHAALLLKMDSPCNQRTMVSRCPCIGPDVDTPWVILEQFSDALAALCIYRLDIAPNGVWRRDCQVCTNSREYIDQFRIANNACGAIVFCYPLCNVGADIDLR